MKIDTLNKKHRQLARRVTKLERAAGKTHALAKTAHQIAKLASKGHGAKR